MLVLDIISPTIYCVKDKPVLFLADNREIFIFPEQKSHKVGILSHRRRICRVTFLQSRLFQAVALEQPLSGEPCTCYFKIHTGKLELFII